MNHITKYNNAVLYVCSKTAYLCHLITIRMTMFREKRSILLVNERYFQLDDIYGKLLEHNIFDEVISVDFKAIERKESIADMNTEELKEEFIRYFDEVLFLKGYSIQDFFEIILLTDYDDFHFEIYLILKQAYYLTFATQSNQFECPPKNISKKVDPLKHVLVETCALTARNKFTTLFYHPKDLHFYHSEAKHRTRYHLLEEIKYILPKDRIKILNAYECTEFQPDTTKGKHVLFVLQGLGPTANPMKREKGYVENYVRRGRTIRALTILAAQIILDYFTESEDVIYIKSHPNVPINKDTLEEDFHNSVHVLPKIPIQFYEFAPSIRTFNFDMFIEYGSETSSVSALYKNAYLLGKDFSKVLPLINKIWFGLGVLETLGINDDICTLDLTPRHVSALAKKRFQKHINIVERKNLSEVAENLIIIKDFATIQGANNNIDAFLILSTIKEPTLEGYHSIPFYIEKLELKKNRRSSLTGEVFYLLVRDTVLLQMENEEKLVAFAETKKLKYVGIELKCNNKKINQHNIVK